MAKTKTLFVIFYTVTENNTLGADTNRDYFRMAISLESAKAHFAELLESSHSHTVSLRCKDTTHETVSPHSIAQKAALARNYDGWVTLQEEAKLTDDELIAEYINNTFLDGHQIYRNETDPNSVVVFSVGGYYKVFKASRGVPIHRRIGV